MTSPQSSILYAVNARNELIWYQHTGAGDGTDHWYTTPTPSGHVGTGWDVVNVFSDGRGAVYSVDSKGFLRWYRHDGYIDGTDRWTYSPEHKGYIGEGWDVPHAFSGGDGILYAVDRAGNLRWYRHLGAADGADRWQTSPEKDGIVGTGWNVRRVFSAGQGILYTIDDAGDLRWYRHDGFADGTARWTYSPEPKGRVGNGWTGLKVFSGGRGVVYSVDAQGYLHWYRHDGWLDGTARWTYSPDPKGHIGEGWAMSQVFSGGFAPRNLGLRMEYQQTGEWCWIAVATSVNRYYDPSSRATQSGTMTYVGHGINGFPMSTSAFPDAAAFVALPALAATLAAPRLPAALGVLGDPKVGLDPRYIKSGGVGDALNVYSNWANRQNVGKPSLAQMSAEIAAGRPIAVDIGWNGGGQHCVAIAGVLDDLLLICDPTSGDSVISYANFPGSYLGGASWVGGCLTIPGPRAV